MTAAPDPTYMNPGTGWSAQQNSGGGTGATSMGTTTGVLNYTSSTVSGVPQSRSPGGANGPLSATFADASGAGAISIDHEKRHAGRGNVPPSHPGDANQGVY